MRVHDSNNDKTSFRKQRRRYDQRGTIMAYSDCLNLPPYQRRRGRKFEQRFGPAETAVDWEWSRARWYAGEEDVPLQMDRTLPIMEE
ncbi:hypothetical protein Mal48_07190 [Thalassoglobus polymorphus]|uniref:Uncharacterized protein n=1 Tax=Thalassoglobus polymorphus TaxID=2527994 RepID=A0A517QIS2_9PLAN|nr:hypothetical protein Mal48_07190 [Thalassoglobus polymorphus]